MHLLLVEDDLELGAAMHRALAQRGMTSQWVRRAKEASAFTDLDSFSCAILDLGLPDGDGLQVLRQWRKSGFDLPVIVLTARDAVRSRVEGLDDGADDYLIKPIEMDELASRIRAIIRRQSGHKSAVWQVGVLQIDVRQRELRINGIVMQLTPKEFKILELLAIQPDAVISKDRIANALAPFGDAVEFNTLEVHIHNLRRKLGNDTIRTLRGVGYKLCS